MDITQLIQQKLPQDLRNLAQRLEIPAKFLETMPDLIELILRSRSLSNLDDKQSWLNLLPIMNEQQIQKLRAILTREKQKLEEIEKKYEQKKMEIKKKYLQKWQQMWYVKKIENIKQQEEQTREKEMEEADSLLENL